MRALNAHRCRLRKFQECEITGIAMLPGDYAFRPLGNQSYRSRRISGTAIEAPAT